MFNQKLSIFLLALLPLLFAVIPDAESDWLLGQNRIGNGDFEGDEVGKSPVKWELAKGG